MSKKSNTDFIAQALQINPLVIPEPNYDPIVISGRDHPATKLVDDVETARTNVIKVIGIGMRSLEDLSELAQAGQQPKAYEVIANLLRSIVDANEKLIGFQKQIRDIEGIEHGDGEGPSTVNNNLFVGTTSEALAMIKKNKIDGSK